MTVLAQARIQLNLKKKHQGTWQKNIIFFPFFPTVNNTIHFCSFRAAGRETGV